MSALEPSPQTSTPVAGKPTVDDELRNTLADIIAVARGSNFDCDQDIDSVQKKLMELTNLIYNADRYIMDCWIGFNQRRNPIRQRLPESTLSIADLGL